MPALNTQKQKQTSKVQNDSILPLFVYIGVTIFFAIGSLTLYHLCGDNLDKCIKQRYMRVGCKKPNSIHYFHSYAVADRVDFNHLCDQVIPTMQRDAKQLASFLLPTLNDDAALRNNICVLMSRILYANMEFFQHSFDGVVDWHIKHEFYDEMSTCYKVVSIEIKIIVAETMLHFNNAFHFTTITTQIPLGIQLKDENKTEDMVQIMANYNSMYLWWRSLRMFMYQTLIRLSKWWKLYLILLSLLETRKRQQEEEGHRRLRHTNHHCQRDWLDWSLLQQIGIPK